MAASRPITKRVDMTPLPWDSDVRHSEVLGVRALDDGVRIPEYQSEYCSGFDLHANADLVIKSKNIALVPTGLVFEIPRGYEIQIRPRSGLALNHMVTVLNSPGTIDSDYRGEIGVLLINFGRKQFAVHKGDRIAQAVLTQIAHAVILVRDELSTTERGRNGFGSTGV